MCLFMSSFRMIYIFPNHVCIKLPNPLVIEIEQNKLRCTDIIQIQNTLINNKLQIKYMHRIIYIY